MGKRADDRPIAEAHRMPAVHRRDELAPALDADPRRLASSSLDVGGVGRRLVQAVPSR
jgi:hypothetical protein